MSQNLIEQNQTNLTFPSSTDVDMQSAWLRKAEANSASFLTKFAYLLKEAIPSHTTLKVISKGFFKKTEEVVGVMIAFDEEIFSMELNKHNTISTSILREVKGIVLSTKSVSSTEWMSSFFEAMKKNTQQATQVVDLLKSL
jgi:hypothetical protein